MKKWGFVVLAVVVGLPIVAGGVGLLLPRDHVAAMTIDLAAPPDRVWSLVSGFAEAATWRTDVTAVRLDAPAAGGALRFTESSSQGEVTFEVVSQDAPRRQVVRIVDDDQPFGGTWTWTLEPAGAGTRLTIVEAGFIKSPIFRTLGALLFSPTATLDAYLRALAARLGESAEPRERAAGEGAGR
jgi:uncharacterized protein YndB with AHSA1/START domain